MWHWVFVLPIFGAAFFLCGTGAVEAELIRTRRSYQDVFGVGFGSLCRYARATAMAAALHVYATLEIFFMLLSSYWLVAVAVPLNPPQTFLVWIGLALFFFWTGLGVVYMAIYTVVCTVVMFSVLAVLAIASAPFVLILAYIDRAARRPKQPEDKVVPPENGVLDDSEEIEEEPNPGVCDSEEVGEEPNPGVCDSEEVEEEPNPGVCTVSVSDAPVVTLEQLLKAARLKRGENKSADYMPDNRVETAAATYRRPEINGRTLSDYLKMASVKTAGSTKRAPPT